MNEFPTFKPLSDLLDDTAKSKPQTQTQTQTQDNTKSDDSLPLGSIVETGQEYKPLNQEPDLQVSNYEKEEEDQTPLITEDEPEPQDLESIKSQYDTAVEMGFLIPPPDFDFDGSPEAIQRVQDYTVEVLAEEARSQALSEIADDQMKAVVEYALNGGNIEGLNLLLSQPDVSNMDISDKDKAIALIKKHQKAIGNDDYVTNLILEKADDEADYDTPAKKALAYFESRQKTTQKQLLEETDLKRQQHKKAIDDYNRAFEQNLKATGYTTQKKRDILSELKPVTTSSGQVMPKFHYTLNQIQTNHPHFIQLLDILNGYNPKTGFDFSSKVQSGKTEVINNFFSKTKSATKKGGSTKSPKRAEVHTNPIDKNITVL